jgi:hypothetical protein
VSERPQCTDNNQQLSPTTALPHAHPSPTAQSATDCSACFSVAAKLAAPHRSELVHDPLVTVTPFDDVSTRSLVDDVDTYGTVGLEPPPTDAVDTAARIALTRVETLLLTAAMLSVARLRLVKIAIWLSVVSST